MRVGSDNFKHLGSKHNGIKLTMSDADLEEVRLSTPRSPISDS